MLTGKKIRTAAFCDILTHSVPPQSWYAPTSLHGIKVPTPWKRTAVPLNTKLGGPHCWSERFGEVKSLTLTGIRTTDRPACTIFALPTALYRLIIITIINIIIIIRPVCRVFTTIYLKQAMFLRYIRLQLLCSYKL
jgi:hypothetical protein